MMKAVRRLALVLVLGGGGMPLAAQTYAGPNGPLRDPGTTSGAARGVAIPRISSRAASDGGVSSSAGERRLRGRLPGSILYPNDR